MGVKEAIVNNETIMKAVDKFIQVTTIGGLIIGTLLVLNKIFGLTFEITVGLGL